MLISVFMNGKQPWEMRLILCSIWSIRSGAFPHCFPAFWANSDPVRYHHALVGNCIIAAGDYILIR